MEEKQRRRSGWGMWLAVALAVPVLYVLSLGPLHLLNHYGMIREREWHVYHAYNSPAILLANYNRPFGAAFRWYMGFFKNKRRHIPEPSPVASPTIP